MLGLENLRLDYLMLAEFSSLPDWGLTVWATGFFHLILGCADIFALWMLRRRPTLKTVVLLAFTWTATMGFLGISLGLETFFMMRLWCYGLFLHLPIVLFAASILLWQAKSPRLAAAFVVGTLLLTAVAYDAFIVEPEWLDVTHRKVVAENITTPLRIAIVADLQTDYFGDYQRDALARCMDERPDLILLAGDYVQVHEDELWAPLRKQLNDYLREINFSAPLGVYAVHGNTDHPEWETLFDGLPITCLADTSIIDLGELDLTGLGIWDSFAWSLKLPRPTADKFHVVLGHAPDFARSADVDADFLIAGHTHGGQIQLPFIGPIMTASTIPRGWANGLTRLAGGKQLLVSRGIGMERGNAPRIRFLCRPELAIVDVLPADGN